MQVRNEVQLLAQVAVRTRWVGARTSDPLEANTVAYGAVCGCNVVGVNVILEPGALDHSTVVLNHRTFATEVEG